jgi:hypothetical protein
MQIGWCTLATPFTSDNSVGDDESSYAFDGYRVKKWNVQSSEYGERWAVGDVIGTLIDFQNKEVSFYRNEKFLGVAFKGIKTGPNMAYFPAIYMSEGCSVIFNFGQRPFKYCFSSAPGILNFAISEPECKIKNYSPFAVYLMDLLKRYVFDYFDFPDLNEDIRLLVASVIWDYLAPIMTSDPQEYLME